MRLRRLLIVIAFMLAGTVLILVLAGPRAPVLSVAGVEPSGVFDDAGTEFLFVRLNFTAQGIPGPTPDGLFIKNIHSWARKGTVNRQVQVGSEERPLHQRGGAAC
jgi:hypothetical protein